MTDTIPKSEVARVLAEMHRACADVQQRTVVAFAAILLNLRPEFESALAAMEKEAGRG